MVKNTDDEYYLLENRQWSGWDLGVPGQGLVVYHVNYKASSWSNNYVNNTENAPNFHLIAADNRDYDSSEEYLIASGSSHYANSGRMNSNLLNGAPYPLKNEEGILNDSLTDTSVPASIVYNNVNGALLMSKPITHITQHDDGTVSFRFMGGDSIPSGITSPSTLNRQPSTIIDLQGRRIYGKPARGLVIKDNRKMIIR